MAKAIPTKIVDELNAAADSYLKMQDPETRPSDRSSLKELLEFWEQEVEDCKPRSTKVTAIPTIAGLTAGLASLTGKLSVCIVDSPCPPELQNKILAAYYIIVGALVSLAAYRTRKGHNLGIMPKYLPQAEEELARVQKVADEYL